MTANFVDFRNVFLAYDNSGDFAVEDISLTTRQGEFIAIVGPSGCGKSTFMKLATGLKAPTRGSVSIDGKPVTGPLKIVGMAFQAPTLLPWRTTLDNVLLPLEIVEPHRSRFRKNRAQYEEQALKLLCAACSMSPNSFSPAPLRSCSRCSSSPARSRCMRGAPSGSRWPVSRWR